MSDIDDMDMNFDQVSSPTPSQDSITTESTTTESGKIKKKPGRKPNPASPQLRKIQNRAAQRAFRERREKHIKELEVDYKKLKIERDTLYKENKILSKENDILKCENWYLKGIVLSLQLVCYKHKLHIPKHTPHIDERALLMMAESAPQGVAAYLNVNNRNKTPNVRKKQGDAPGFVFTDQGVETVLDNDNDNDSRQYEDESMIDKDSTTSTHSTSEKSTSTSNISNSNTIRENINNHSYVYEDKLDFDTEMLQPVLLTQDTTKNNMRAIQALRLRLRLQNALMREKLTPYRIEPSLLQLTVPHDPRIDLLPTVHMRDRMILYRDQFDLDDCLRLLVNDAVFHGGDPSQAINWELPPVFFEKYWFLTTNYTLERTSQKWRDFKNKITDENPPATMCSPPSTTASTTVDHSDKQQDLNNQIHMKEKNTLDHQHQPVYLNPSDSSSNNNNNDNDNNSNNDKQRLHTMVPFETSNDHPILQESISNNNSNSNSNNKKTYNISPQQPIDNNMNNAVPDSLIAPNSSNYFNLNTSPNVNSLPYSNEYPMSAQRFMQVNSQPYMQLMEQQSQQPQQSQAQQQQQQQQEQQQSSSQQSQAQQQQQQQEQQQSSSQQQQPNWNSLYYFDFLGE